MKESSDLVPTIYMVGKEKALDSSRANKKLPSLLPITAPLKIHLLAIINT